MENCKLGGMGERGGGMFSESKKEISQKNGKKRKKMAQKHLLVQYDKCNISII